MRACVLALALVASERGSPARDEMCKCTTGDGFTRLTGGDRRVKQCPPPL